VKYDIKDKSQALRKIKHYGKCEVEPELRPEFVEEIEETRKRGKFIKVKDFAEEFDIQR
jgi:hypothetical protein